MLIRINSHLCRKRIKLTPSLTKFQIKECVFIIWNKELVYNMYLVLRQVDPLVPTTRGDKKPTFFCRCVFFPFPNGKRKMKRGIEFHPNAILDPFL